MIPERREPNEMSSMIASVYCLEGVSKATVQEGGTQTECMVSPSCGDRVGNSGRPRWLEFSGQDTRQKRTRDSDWRSVEGFSQFSAKY